MNPLQKKQLKLLYKQLYDVQDQNSINIHELNRANLVLQNSNSQTYSSKLLSQVLRNRKQPHEGYKDEVLNYEEFEDRVTKFVSEQEKLDKQLYQVLFELFDQDKDGLLNQDDLMQFLRQVGSTMDQKQVVDFFQLMTSEGIHLTKKQFISIWTKKDSQTTLPQM